MTELPVQFKFIVIGARGSGKTSIVRRLVDNKFVKTSQSTVGIEYFTHIATVAGRTVKMMIWDTAGQERFYTVAKAYFRNALGVVLVFDICDRKSFEQLPRWLRDARMEADAHCTVYLVGNKSDLRPTRTVSQEEAEQFAKEHQLEYVETSAADNTGIEEVFLKISESLLGKVANGSVSAGTQLPGSGGVAIEDHRQEKNKGTCPC
jgi:small GTP-binding protein